MPVFRDRLMMEERIAARGGTARPFTRVCLCLGILLALPVGLEGRELWPARGPGVLYAQALPIERQLSAGTTGFLRTVSKRFRQMRKVFANAAARWQAWIGGASIFLLLSVVAPVVDRSVLGIWRAEGGRAFIRALSAAVVVYVRLLLDSRTPALGKALVAFAVIYGASGSDIMPDRAGLVWGLSDDIILIVLASRSLMRMCPDELIAEHAVRVANSRERGSGSV